MENEFASHDFDRILEWRSSHDGIVQEKVGQLRVEEEISPRRLDRCHGDLMLSSILRSNISFTCSGLVNRPSSVPMRVIHLSRRKTHPPPASTGSGSSQRRLAGTPPLYTICRNWHNMLARSPGPTCLREHTKISTRNENATHHDQEIKNDQKIFHAFHSTRHHLAFEHWLSRSRKIFVEILL